MARIFFSFSKSIPKVFMFFKFLIWITCIAMVSVVFQTDSVAELNSDFANQEKICHGLSQEECFANDDCIGGYGSSYCVPNGPCTMDMVYKSCYPSGLNAGEIQQIKTECEQINGEFAKDRFSGYECLCTKPDYIGKDRCLLDLINKLKSN